MFEVNFDFPICCAPVIVRTNDFHVAASFRATRQSSPRLRRPSLICSRFWGVSRLSGLSCPWSIFDSAAESIGCMGRSFRRQELLLSYKNSSLYRCAFTKLISPLFPIALERPSPKRVPLASWAGSTPQPIRRASETGKKRRLLHREPRDQDTHPRALDACMSSWSRRCPLLELVPTPKRAFYMQKSWRHHGRRHCRRVLSRPRASSDTWTLSPATGRSGRQPRRCTWCRPRSIAGFSTSRRS